MSVINKVLADLDRRGAPLILPDYAIRAVPMRADKSILMRLMLGAMLVGLAMTVALIAQQKISTTDFSSKYFAGEYFFGEELNSPPAALFVPSVAIPAVVEIVPIDQKITVAIAEPKKEIPAALLLQNKKSARAPRQVIEASSLIKQMSKQQQADNEFRSANILLQQARTHEAVAGYKAVLKLYPAHDAARLSLVDTLLKNKQDAHAKRVLKAGHFQFPEHSGFAMLLARLQVEHGELPQALKTLQQSLRYAERQADYRAFMAALLQRQNLHQEAIAHYQAALQLNPNSGVWLMGMGISLQALQKNNEAIEVFKNALDTQSLNADLQAFVTQRLGQLAAG